MNSTKELIVHIIPILLYDVPKLTLLQADKKTAINKDGNFLPLMK